MVRIKRLPEFDEWMQSLKDPVITAKLNRRLERVKNGVWGDVEYVGEKVFVMSEHFGVGWRMYYMKHVDTIIVMLGGGTKSKQQLDLDRAIALAKTLED